MQLLEFIFFSARFEWSPPDATHPPSNASLRALHQSVPVRIFVVHVHFLRKIGAVTQRSRAIR